MDFSTESGGQYILDSNTGAVIPITPMLQQAIELYATKPIEQVVEELARTYSLNAVQGTVKFLQRWRQQFGGLYRSDKDNITACQKRDAAMAKDYEDNIAAGNITQLVLTVTNNCNFRCSYCNLSDAYQYTRNRTKDVMSIETGTKALDMFFGYIRPVADRIPGKIVAVTFFGGEPLMNLGLIKPLVEYAKDHCPTGLLLNLTTNGYLLTNEIGDYLVDNNIKIAVSLDGTKQNHDRNRILSNGSGTFDVVYDNIRAFMKRHPDYVGLLLLPVYDYLTDLEANVDFFNQEDLPPVAFMGPVTMGNTSYYDQFTSEDRRAHVEQVGRLLEVYKGYRKQGKIPPSFLNMLFVHVELIALRTKGGDKRSFLTPYTSNCIPGYRIHVRVDGTLDMCERVNESFPIGHVDTGVDYDAIKNIMDLYNAGVTTKCHECPISKYCFLCAATCNKDCSFCSDMSCRDIQARFKENYRIYYSLCEHNHQAFDNLQHSLLEAMMLYA